GHGKYRGGGERRRTISPELGGTGHLPPHAADVAERFVQVIHAHFTTQSKHTLQCKACQADYRARLPSSCEISAFPAAEGWLCGIMHLGLCLSKFRKPGLSEPPCLKESMSLGALCRVGQSGPGSLSTRCFC